MESPDGNNAGDGAICPLGHYCPTGSKTYTPCQNGTYTNTLGQATCHTCEEGKVFLEFVMSD
ncbi:hypothetical protein DPMN_185100 [Dreissena polymorpha]|uniref:Tyrosine-protein kinase ephrin type A/B receptor-like domain-containing protein n=1 Tax=Dreissena polymorpha TaxID=45954 RepID=A0A9D4DKF3_DREPO|nr:hypothetical protein DPMN_185100 [Dreissena polymorpha]